jgi:hypothetical protein
MNRSAKDRAFDVAGALIGLCLGLSAAALVAQPCRPGDPGIEMASAMLLAGCQEHRR